MKGLFISIFAFFLLFLQGCGATNTEDTLSEAESAISTGNIPLAMSNCSLLADTTVALSPTQACRLALIYAKASELADNQDYMATAAQYYDRAMGADAPSDSLARYIEELDVEAQGLLRVIREVSHSINTPVDYSESTSDEEDADTNQQ